MHAHLLDEEGRQRLVRHGFPPGRDVVAGIGTVPVAVPRMRDRGAQPDASGANLSSFRAFVFLACVMIWPA